MPEIKDYYKILNVRSSASASEIKNVYRRLAMKYHPDHNTGDELSAAVFAEMAEAYKILSDPHARKLYNHKRTLTAQQEYKRPAETMEILIHRIKKINAYINATDSFRLNKDALLYSIRQLFPADISLLLHTDDDLLKQFLVQLCNAVARLSSHQTKQIVQLLQPLYKKQTWLHGKLNELLLRQQTQERWEKYKIVLAIAVAIILCMIIFIAARK